MPTRWYHGSPYAWRASMKEFRGAFIFLTDSKRVAEQYTSVLPASGVKRDVDFAYIESATVFEVRLLFDERLIFDTRRADHRELFVALAKASDGEFTRGDMMRVHPAPGSQIGGTFPGFGTVQPLLYALDDLGLCASFFGEGTHGASLAVLCPQENVEIVQVESL